MSNNNQVNFNQPPRGTITRVNIDAPLIGSTVIVNSPGARTHNSQTFLHGSIPRTGAARAIGNSSAPDGTTQNGSVYGSTVVINSPGAMVYRNGQLTFPLGSTSRAGAAWANGNSSATGGNTQGGVNFGQGNGGGGT